MSHARPTITRSLLSTLVLFSATSCAPESDNDKQNRLAAQAAAAYDAKDWPQAIRTYRKLVELAPDNATHAYNLACTCALGNHADEAVQWLAEAARRGFSRLTLLQRDSDLDRVRSHAGFPVARALVEGNRQKVLADLRARFDKTPPVVVLPPDHDSDEPAPLIIALHGYGGRARHMVGPWQKIAAEMGAILMAPQAVFPIPGSGGPTWIDPNRINDPTCTDDALFLVELTLEQALRDYRIDKEHMILTGFSQGGIITTTSAPRTTHRFAGAIPMAGGYLPRFDAPPKATGDRPTRFYFMIGEREQAVPQYELAVKDFTAAGFQARLRICPGVGHTFPKDWEREAREALDFVLGEEDGA